MVRAVVLVSLAGCGRLGFGDKAPLDGTSADATADATADAHPDAAPLGPCTPLSFSDDFNDGTTAAPWTVLANNPVTVAETGGQLEVTLSTAGGAHYGGYDSTAVWNLTNHCMYVSFTTTPTSEANVEMTFTARQLSGTIGFVYHLGVLDPFVNAGTFQSFGSVPYDPVLHKVLRLREDNGTTSWETSADGTTFTVLTSQPDPLDLTGIQVILEAGTYASAPSPGIARYDNFDTP